MDLGVGGMDLGGGGVYRYGDLHCSASLDVAPYCFWEMIC